MTALLDSARELGAPHHLGIIRAVDALYSDLLPDTMPNGPQLKAELAMWARAGVVANDMDRQMAYFAARQFPAFSVTNHLKTDAEARHELEKL